MLKKIIFEYFYDLKDEEKKLFFSSNLDTRLLSFRYGIKFFHLSSKYLGENFQFTPKVPNNPYVDKDQNIIEDNFTPRVSLASSINDALDALQNPGAYFVYGTKEDLPVESISLNLGNCPSSEDNSYGINFKLIDWLKQKFDIKDNDEDGDNEEQLDIYDRLNISRSKEISPDWLNKNIDGNLGDEFEGCVPDSDETKEKWSLEPIVLACLGYLDENLNFHPSKSFFSE